MRLNSHMEMTASLGGALLAIAAFARFMDTHRTWRAGWESGAT